MAMPYRAIAYASASTATKFTFMPVPEGTRVQEDLSPAGVVFAVKEVPARLFLPGKTYMFFAHVIKGQPHNMPMLRRLMELGCNLIDYEKVTDELGHRLIFFGWHAGVVSVIESLWALGRRLEWEGIANPFDALRHTYSYDSLAEARADLRGIGERIKAEGLPGAISPLIIGIAGYGNCMGVPTVAGEVAFHGSYDGNCLVNAMAVGIAFGRAGSLAADGYALFFEALLLAVAIGVVLLSPSYLRENGLERGEYYALVLFAAAIICNRASRFSTST